MRRFTLILLSLTVSACDMATSPDLDTPAQANSVAERMGGTPDPGFRRADRPRAFDFPADHGAHPAYATEWWYFTGNLKSAQGRRLGYQFTLFRVALRPGPPATDSPWRSQQLYMGHLALTDIDGQRHLSSERFSRAAAGLAGAESSPLRVWLGSWSVAGEDREVLFPLSLRADSEELELQLALTAGDKPRVLQGDRGWSRKSAAPGNASYYYSHTRLPTQGRVRLGKTWYEVTGNSWFDREWSSSALASDQAGWDWFSLQLTDGRELMFYQLRDHQGRGQSFSQGVLVDKRGASVRLDMNNTRLQPTAYWTSPEGIEYPVSWRLAVPSQGISINIKAAVADQEMDHSVRYWEGAVEVSGSHSGVGYLELSGYKPP